jgi:hypothetical protein
MDFSRLSDRNQSNFWNDEIPYIGNYGDLKLPLKKSLQDERIFIIGNLASKV